GFLKTELSHPGARVTAGGVTQTNASPPTRRPDRFVIGGIAVCLLIAAIVGTMSWSGSTVPEVSASPPATPSLEIPQALPAPPLAPPPAPPAPPSASAQAPVVPALLEPVVDPVLPPLLKPTSKPAPVAKPKATSDTKAAPDRHNVRIP
ncbi:MAG TPA: hypothetical protein VK459_17325, partial [Polyangiaceae bacterium]|nr:hypothetical protein [Polyangiaceae bacterium]